MKEDAKKILWGEGLTRPESESMHVVAQESVQLYDQPFSSNDS